MAVISQSTFDALQSFVAVRLQQGVPIVDADWNELDDIRRFEVRAFLKWFVGDGLPEGNDGFRITASGQANDFSIQSDTTAPADGLRNAGRCLVDGWDVMITSDVAYTAQPLHADRPDAAARAAAWSVPVIESLTAPIADGVALVYLDVWERLVTPSEDVNLIHAGLGTESCARLKREWVVRTRPGEQVPQPSDGPPDYVAGHAYYPLATLRRRAGDAQVHPGDVTDLRERNLQLLPSTLVTDLFGVSAAQYRRGQGRPPLSLRAVLNALLRGELPGTAPQPIAPNPSQDLIGRGFLVDAAGGVLAAWRSNRVGNIDQVFVSRWDPLAAQPAFSAPPTPVTTGVGHTAPHAALLPNGDLFVVYETGLGNNAEILFKRAPWAQLTAAAEQSVANTPNVPDRDPFVVASGGIAVVFWHQGAGTNLWTFRRYRASDATWLDPAAVTLSAQNATQRQFHAARDAAGNVWVAFREGVTNIRALRLAPVAGTVGQETSLQSGTAFDQQPFVLPLAQGDVSVFWQGADGLYTARHAGGWQPATRIAPTLTNDRQPSAVEDDDGGIWLFFTRGIVPSTDIYFTNRNPDSGLWSEPRQLTVAPDDESAPSALRGPDGAVWVFWSRDHAGNIDLYFRKLIVSI
jgi:hypothetical protein